jgi:hypothetical protein
VGSGSGLKGGGCIRKEDHHLWVGAGLVIGRLLQGRAKGTSIRKGTLAGKHGRVVELSISAKT